MKAYLEGKEKVISILESNTENGLTDDKVGKSLIKYGPNHFSNSKDESIFLRIWNALCEPMIFILLIAAFITLSVNIYVI